MGQCCVVSEQKNKKFSRDEPIFKLLRRTNTPDIPLWVNEKKVKKWRNVLDGTKNLNVFHENDETTRNLLLKHEKKLRENMNYSENESVLFKEFEEAIAAYDWNQAIALIEEYSYADFINHPLKNDDYALHISIKQRNARFSYFLLQKGANSNCQNLKTGESPLHYATRNKDIRMITLLLKWNANVNLRNYAEETPKEIANLGNDHDVAQMFDQNFQAFLTSKTPTARFYSSTANGITTQFGKNEDKFLGIPNKKLHSLSETQKNSNQDNIKTNENNNIIIKLGYDKMDKNKTPFTILSDNENSSEDDQPFLTRDSKNLEVKFNSDSDLINSRSIRALRTMLTQEKTKTSLQTLSGWLRKKKGHSKHYKKMHLTIVDGHLLWNDKLLQRHYDEDGFNLSMSQTEKNRWKGSLSLMSIKEVKPHDSKKDNTWKFEIHSINLKHLVKDKSKVHIWKCDSKDIRDHWVNCIQQHLNYYQNFLDACNQM